MVSPKPPGRLELEPWWRCGDQSPVSCGDSSVVSMANDEPDGSKHSCASKTKAAPCTPASYSIQTMRSLVQGMVSPFMNCVAPPIGMCTTTSPQRPQAGQHCDNPDVYVYMSPPSVASQQSSSSKLVLSSPFSMPLVNIEICHVHCNDVLCGRSSGAPPQEHVGNRNFRDLVAANGDVYARLLSKQQQVLAARSIVDMVHSTRPAGRFLVRDAMTGLWNDIGMAQSIAYTLQALKEASHLSNNEAGSQMAEDRSVAVTAVSESIASVSTTPASNHSHGSMPALQLVVPTHLRHVYYITPRAIPNQIHSRSRRRQRFDATSIASPAPLSTLSTRPASSCQTDVIAPGAVAAQPISPTSTAAEYCQAYQYRQHPSINSEPLSPVSTPSAPPAIWRIHNNTCVVSSQPNARFDPFSEYS